MRFTNRHGDAIQSLDEWRAFAPPAAKDHWKPGRSAYELAADWIDRDAAARVAALLGTRAALAGLELQEGIAEKQTHFDNQGRGPRNHDLLIRGVSDAGPVTIGVEGKADEPFDLALWRWREKLLRQSPNSGAPERLDRLTTMYFGTTIEKDRGWPALACIGYQLLSALAGTLRDALHDGAHAAVVLIHEFRTDQTSDELHEVNARVLDDFLVRLGTEMPAAAVPGGWITEPFVISGDGEWAPSRLPVHIAKLVTDVR